MPVADDTPKNAAPVPGADPSSVPPAKTVPPAASKEEQPSDPSSRAADQLDHILIKRLQTGVNQKDAGRVEWSWGDDNAVESATRHRFTLTLGDWGEEGKPPALDTDTQLWANHKAPNDPAQLFRDLHEVWEKIVRQVNKSDRMTIHTRFGDTPRWFMVAIAVLIHHVQDSRYNLDAARIAKQLADLVKTVLGLNWLEEYTRKEVTDEANRNVKQLLSQIITNSGVPAAGPQVQFTSGMPGSPPGAVGQTVHTILIDRRAPMSTGPPTTATIGADGARYTTTITHIHPDSPDLPKLHHMWNPIAGTNLWDMSPDTLLSVYSPQLDQQETARRTALNITLAQCALTTAVPMLVKEMVRQAQDRAAAAAVAGGGGGQKQPKDRGPGRLLKETYKTMEPVIWEATKAAWVKMCMRQPYLRPNGADEVVARKLCRDTTLAMWNGASGADGAQRAKKQAPTFVLDDSSTNPDSYGARLYAAVDGFNSALSGHYDLHAEALRQHMAVVGLALASRQ